MLLRPVRSIWPIFYIRWLCLVLLNEFFKLNLVTYKCSEEARRVPVQSGYHCGHLLRLRALLSVSISRCIMGRAGHYECCIVGVMFTSFFYFSELLYIKPALVGTGGTESCECSYIDMYMQN